MEEEKLDCRSAQVSWTHKLDPVMLKQTESVEFLGKGFVESGIRVSFTKVIVDL